MVRGRATGASYAPHYGVQGAAPLLLGRRNDEKDGDRRRSTESYGDGEATAREREGGEVLEDRQLTRSSWEGSRKAGEAGTGGNGARRPDSGDLATIPCTRM